MKNIILAIVTLVTFSGSLSAQEAPKEKPATREPYVRFSSFNARYFTQMLNEVEKQDATPVQPVQVEKVSQDRKLSDVERAKMMDLVQKMNAHIVDSTFSDIKGITESVGGFRNNLKHAERLILQLESLGDEGTKEAVKGIKFMVKRTEGAYRAGSEAAQRIAEIALETQNKTLQDECIASLGYISRSALWRNSSDTRFSDEHSPAAQSLFAMGYMYETNHFSESQKVKLAENIKYLSFPYEGKETEMTIAAEAVLKKLKLR